MDHFPWRAEIPSGIQTEAEGRAWLKETFPARDELLAAYSAAIQEETKQMIQALTAQAAGLKTDLEKARLSILTIDELRWDPRDHLVDWKQWLGVFITTVLLSLGAPFWFNTLRTLSNLRPSLAGVVDPSKK